MFTRNLLVFMICVTTHFPALAEDVPNTFIAGEPADAEDVNANFSTLVTQIEALQAQVAALEALNAAPTMASVAGTHAVAELGMSLLENSGQPANSESVGIGMFGISGTVTFNANGTGTASTTEIDNHLSISSFNDTINPENTDLFFDTFTDTIPSEAFTWSLGGTGNSELTLTFPDTGEGADILTLIIATGGNIAVASESFPEDGEVGLLIIVRQ